MPPTRSVALALAAGLLLAACGDQDGDAAAGTFAGIVRDPAPVVADLALPDASAGDEPFALRAGSGEVLLVYFGYTACPDVCPTSMADARTALRGLGDGAERVELAMITVDPARDTGEILAAYVDSFVDGSHALRTDDEGTLLAVADAFGASYSVVPTAEGDVEVGHTAFLYAVDDAGTVRVTWPFGTPPADIQADLELLLSLSRR